jgi:WD repeat-containing protein 6
MNPPLEVCELSPAVTLLIQSSIKANVWQYEYLLNPVTALQLLQVGEKLLLLAGEGPYLKIFDHSTSEHVYSTRSFDSANIHGIVVDPSAPADDSCAIRILVWGGRSFRAFNLHIKTQNEDSCRQVVSSPSGCFSVSLEELGLEQTASDWILDISLCCSQDDNGHDMKSKKLFAAIATAQNDIHLLDLYSTPTTKPMVIRSHIRSILYSAHVIWVSTDHVLCAAGTVFGEILVWSCYLRDHKILRTELHSTLTGHEGSIFGVQFSHPDPSTEGATPRLLASCSDDRTLRIWDIQRCLTEQTEDLQKVSENAVRSTGFSAKAPEDINGQIQSGRCVATGWAHTSRVWGIKFLLEEQSGSSETSLITRGEDATCRQWSLRFEPEKPEDTTLEAIETFNPHSGKHIWAFAISKSVIGQDSPTIVTGGSDGRIATFRLLKPVQSSLNLDEVKDYLGEDSKIMIRDPAINISRKRKVAVKNYAFASEEDLLVVTDAGSILHRSILVGVPMSKSSNPSVDYRWREVGTLRSLYGDSVVAECEGAGKVFFAGSGGSVHMYDNVTHTVRLVKSVKCLKVGRLFAQRRDSE